MPRIESLKCLLLVTQVLLLVQKCTIFIWVNYNCIHSSKYGTILNINAPGRRYSHIRTVRVCAARRSPIFRPWPLLKPLLFRPGPPQKTPFLQYTILSSAFPTWADRKDPRLKKNTFLCYFKLQNPLFSPLGAALKVPPPQFSARGCSLSLPFLYPARHIYTNFIFECTHAHGINAYNTEGIDP